MILKSEKKNCIDHHNSSIMFNSDSSSNHDHSYGHHAGMLISVFISICSTNREQVLTNMIMHINENNKLSSTYLEHTNRCMLFVAVVY